MKRFVKLSKRLLVIILCIGLTGCSNPLGMVTGALTGNGGISAQVGEEANKQIVGEQNKLEAEGDINQTTISNTNINNIFLFALILGWLMPAPNVIYKEFKSIIKGFGTWILSLFNKRI